MVGKHLPHPHPGVAIVHTDLHLHLGQRKNRRVRRLLICRNQHPAVRMRRHPHCQQDRKRPICPFHRIPHCNLSSEILTRPLSVPTYTTPLRMASAVTFNDGNPAVTAFHRVPLASPTINPWPSVPASTRRLSAAMAVGFTTTPARVASVVVTLPSAASRNTPAP